MESPSSAAPESSCKSSGSSGFLPGTERVKSASYLCHSGGVVTKRMIIAAIVLWFSVAFAFGQKQSPVDLSGTWKLDRDRSKLAVADRTRSDIVSIFCSGSTVRMDFPHGDEPSNTYIADGKEHQPGTDRGSPLHLKASWRKGSLVTEIIVRTPTAYIPPFDPGDQGTASPWEPVHTKDRWTLSSDGRVLTREIDAPKRILVYDKQ